MLEGIEALVSRRKGLHPGFRSTCYNEFWGKFLSPCGPQFQNLLHGVLMSIESKNISEVKSLIICLPQRKFLINGSFNIASVIAKWVYVCHGLGHIQENKPPRTLWERI